MRNSVRNPAFTMVLLCLCLPVAHSQSNPGRSTSGEPVQMASLAVVGMNTTVH
jgi:hypothetical protein